MTIIEGIIKKVEKFHDSIVNALDTKNISNTREAAESLRIEFGFDFVRSIGIFYLEFLDTGRGPGKPPPFGRILEWAMQRTGEDASGAWGLAVYTRDKIARLGTQIFRNNSEGIELSEKILTLREEINKSIRKSVDFTLNQRLDRFKIAFNNLNFRL